MTLFFFREIRQYEEKKLASKRNYFKKNETYVSGTLQA